MGFGIIAFGVAAAHQSLTPPLFRLAAHILHALKAMFAAATADGAAGGNQRGGFVETQGKTLLFEYTRRLLFVRLLSIPNIADNIGYFPRNLPQNFQ